MDKGRYGRSHASPREQTARAYAARGKCTLAPLPLLWASGSFSCRSGVLRRVRICPACQGAYLLLITVYVNGAPLDYMGGY